VPESTQRLPAAGRRFDPRWLALAAALGLAAVPPHLAWLAALVPSLSPLTAIASGLATRGLRLAIWIGLPGLLLAAALPRGLCRYACPLGPVLDRCGRRRDRPERIPAATGRVLLGVILGAAALGWPFLLWLDPFTCVNALARMLRHPWSVASIAAGLIVLLPVTLSVWRPRAWCARVCPLGALQDVMTGLRQGQVRGASGEGVGPAAPALTRRMFLGAGAGVLVAAAARAAGGSAPAPLRPPGAVSGVRFGAVCIRCGNCAAACPSRIIQPDPGRHGVVSFLSPMLDFSRDYCREDCRRCTEVCPSGALTPLRTGEEKRAWRIGLARVDLDTCLLAAGGECTACVTACPYGAITVFSEGFEVGPRIERSLCNGCGACESVCPVGGLPAILVSPEP
jgi:ferredoxin-type protein NapF